MKLLTKEELIDKLITYSEQVTKKKITACIKHQWACKRFLSDIKQIKKKTYPYYFDIEEVHRFYLWSGLFKHTKGYLAGQHIELTDFQLFIISNIFGWKKKANDRRRYKKSYIQLGRKNGRLAVLIRNG